MCVLRKLPQPKHNFPILNFCHIFVNLPISLEYKLNGRTVSWNHACFNLVWYKIHLQAFWKLLSANLCLTFSLLEMCKIVSSGSQTVVLCCWLDFYTPTLLITLLPSHRVKQWNICWHKARTADKVIFFAEKCRNYTLIYWFDSKYVYLWAKSGP